jgi:hypothetical protein
LSTGDLRRRLSRIESGRHEGAPTLILTDRPPGVGPDIHVEDWQAWIADGLGIVTNGVLCVTGLELTAIEWAARHVSEHVARSAGHRLFKIRYGLARRPATRSEAEEQRL